MTATTISGTDDDELTELREIVRVLVKDVGGTRPLRRILETGRAYDREVWDIFAGQMALAGLGIGEEAGGSGGGLPELVTVAEELGRSLLPVPFLSSTVLAGQALLAAGDEELTGLLAEGRVVALAALDDAARWNPSSHRVSVVDGRLAGTVPLVFGGTEAEFLVVPAHHETGIDLFATDATAAGVTLTPLRTLDDSRPFARLDLRHAPARRLTFGGAGKAAVDTAMRMGVAVITAEQLGAAQACLDATVDYVKLRTQFGRAIGSFQAVKHRCADMLILVEMARSAVDRMLTRAADPTAFADAVAAAKAWCSDAFRTVAAETVHLHGGIGFTWEHDAHLYVRRANVDAALFGDATFHREQLARLHGW